MSRGGQSEVAHQWYSLQFPSEASAACMDAADADAMRWLRSLCEEGLSVPLDPEPRPRPGLQLDALDAARFARGQRVAREHLFSLAYAELVSLLMMFSFEDQTATLMATRRSHTPAKAYVRYLSTMRRVRSWYEGDLWNPESEAARNLKVVRRMHHRVNEWLSSEGRVENMTLHTRAVLACPLGDAPVNDAPVDPRCTVAMAARQAFSDDGNSSSSCRWANMDSKQPPVINQRGMAVTQVNQVAFFGLFILVPERFGAHGVPEEDLDALVYVWWVLGRALGIQDRFNACGDEKAAGPCLRTTRARCRAVLDACVAPRLSRVSAHWQHMASALCDGAAIAAPGLSLPLALSCLVDVLGAVKAGKGECRRVHPAPVVERIMSLRDRVWRSMYGLVLDHAMRFGPGRAFHNAMFRLSLWVSERLTESLAERLARARPPIGIGPSSSFDFEQFVSPQRVKA